MGPQTIRNIDGCVLPEKYGFSRMNQGSFFNCTSLIVGLHGGARARRLG